MREILFRGKRTLNGDWIEGLLWKKKYNDNRIFISYFPDQDDYEEAYSVCPETIGQYTGLTDKNGKNIFEGDIVTQPVRETRKHSPCIVEFKDGKFQAHYISEKRFFDRYYDLNSYTKVIGNIHDNPELLKGGENDV